jgi:DNA-binding Lrp family transcriptional regulator
MQEQEARTEPRHSRGPAHREALHRLPELLGKLLGEPGVEPKLRREPWSGVDAAADIRGKLWVFEAKSSSRPGVVALAADRLQTLTEHPGPPGSPPVLAVLVVPFMTPAGAKAAAERELNWIDLSGNAHIRDDDLYLSVQGHPNQSTPRGRPSSPFAAKSSRVTRALLHDPEHWWRQKEIADATGLDDGHVSRIVRRLDDEELLERQGARRRPRSPGLLLDAWSDDYHFERHDIIIGHASGSGILLAHELNQRLERAKIEHAFTGLPAAYALEPFARFRLNSVYVHGDPREAADAVGMRRHQSGANVQIIGPEDHGVFWGRQEVAELPCVSPVQVYLDLQHLPERAKGAARQLRDKGLLWHGTR